MRVHGGDAHAVAGMRLLVVWAPAHGGAHRHARCFERGRGHIPTEGRTRTHHRPPAGATRTCPDMPHRWHGSAPHTHWCDTTREAIAPAGRRRRWSARSAPLGDDEGAAGPKLGLQVRGPPCAVPARKKKKQKKTGARCRRCGVATDVRCTLFNKNAARNRESEPSRLRPGTPPAILTAPAPWSTRRHDVRIKRAGAAALPARLCTAS